MKYLITFFLITFLCFSLHAAELDPITRDYYIKNIPSWLSDELKDESIKVCWNDGLNGNDNSLSALYIMYRHISYLKKSHEQTVEFLNNYKQEEGKLMNVSPLIKSRDMKRLKLASVQLRQVFTYCNLLLEKSKEND